MGCLNHHFIQWLVYLRSLLQKVRRPYDVYHDTNVKETVKCRPVLERFAVGVNVLLVEWPDHPTLKQVCISGMDFTLLTLFGFSILILTLRGVRVFLCSIFGGYILNLMYMQILNDFSTFGV